MQYLGMGLLFLHTKKRTDLQLDWKLIILMIIFAPFSQMGFLASYIFYWNKGDPEQEVGQTLQYQQPKITPTLSKYRIKMFNDL